MLKNVQLSNFALIVLVIINDGVGLSNNCCVEWWSKPL